MTPFYSKIEQLLSDESFQRWLTKTGSADENERWSALLQADYSHHNIYQEAIKLWNSVQFNPARLPDINNEWKLLQQHIGRTVTKRAADIGLDSKDGTSHWHFAFHQSWIRYGAIAAAACLIFLIWYFIPQISNPEKHVFQTISTEYGQRVRISLPRGFEIILNANSTLKYPTNWTEKKNRNFELQGEAYFVVTPIAKSGVQHNFIISTNDGEIMVVGTQFAVFERGRGTTVAVEKGRVKVAVAADTGKTAAGLPATVLMESGQILRFKKGDRFLSATAENVNVYTSWWTDHLVLDNTPFKDIVNRLQDTYGVEIEVRNQDLLERSLSGSIENSNLQIMITALAKALQTPVQHNGDIIIFG